MCFIQNAMQLLKYQLSCVAHSVFILFSNLVYPQKNHNSFFHLGKWLTSVTILNLFGIQVILCALSYFQIPQLQNLLTNKTLRPIKNELVWTVFCTILII